MSNFVNFNMEQARLLGRMLGYGDKEIADDIERLDSDGALKMYQQEMADDEEVAW